MSLYQFYDDLPVYSTNRKRSSLNFTLVDYFCQTITELVPDRFKPEQLISDKEIIEAISRQDRKHLDPAMDQLYKEVFPGIKTYMLRNSGSEEEAHDIFQDALVIFYMRVRKGGFENKSSLNTYLYAVSKNLWLKQLRKKRAADAYSPEDESHEFPQELILQENQITIRQVLELIDKACRQLLIGFYFDKRSVKQLKAEYNLGSDAATKNKKYRCLKKLTNLVKERKWLRSDFAND